MTGQILGGALISANLAGTGWRAIFLINVPVGVLVLGAWALLTLVMTTGSYYALLFTLAQYLQTGLGDSALVSGLILVPWVAAFGLAGPLARRLPARTAPMVPAAGCLLLALATRRITT